MNMLSLSHATRRLRIQEFEIDSPIVFEYFDRIPATEREARFVKALYIGVLAQMEDRLATFLSKTANELGTELESLKRIFDLKHELFYRSAIKGSVAEAEIADELAQFFSAQGFRDTAQLTGNNAGSIPRNKTGDVVCRVDGRDDLRIVIECKLDKSIRLGDIQSKDLFAKRSDSAWSQLLEADVNRNGKIAVIVFDAAVVDGSLLTWAQNVRYVPAIGFVAIVDSQKGHFTNLHIAYLLARDIALNARPLEFDKDLLAVILTRLIKDIGDALRTKELILSNIETNKRILLQLEKSMLSMEFTQRYLAKFLSDGTLSKEDLLQFYMGDEVRDRYRPIESEIQRL